VPLDAGMVEGAVELGEQLLVRLDQVWLDPAVQAERRQPARYLADVPLDGMQPVAAVADVGGAEVLGGWEQVADAHG
jgi:hypothetical protein